MKQYLVVFVSVLSLLAGSISPVLAQAEPSNPIFLPQISSGAGNKGTGELILSPESSSIQSQPSQVIEVDKGVSAARSASAANELKLVSIIVVFDESVSPEQLAAISGGQVVHRYKKVFNGASLVVDEQRIDAVAETEGVTAVYLDTLQQPDTDASPAFIGAPTVWNALGGQASAGEAVTVGILDTGIWPEHPSFADPDPSGKSYAAPSVLPGSNGFGSGGARNTCDFGNAAYNAADAPFTCNNKLIGAYSFIDTYKLVVGLLPEEFDSARDDNGHGTHTASTSAGNAGVNAAIFGIDRGVISGIAPRAHVIAYRVCADQGCYQSDSVAAIDQAILDGVNVINFSIGGGSTPYDDAVELAFLRAYENGVFVAASAGNSGPGPETVDHRGPWVTTVGASTSNRHFLSTLTLTADNGDALQLIGATVTAGINTPTPVVVSSDPSCALPAGTFTGKIVICGRVGARLQIGANAAKASASGMILRNVTAAQGQDVLTDNHFLPTVHIGLSDGQTLQKFMDTHSGVLATFTQGAAQTVPGDKMASFSSRGGPEQTLGVSKPDITAPGVQILAGTTPLPATVLGGLPGQLFQSIQGTSMSSPHIAGAAALLKALHPAWTPGQIKSSLMTTAKVGGVTKEDGITPADPFDFGSGRVDLTKAGDAGLTFDESAADYESLESELWNANYPSLYVPNMPGHITVERTLHNERNEPRNWKLEVTAPGDLKITVPKHVEVAANSDVTFAITVDASTVPQGEVRHALLEFKQGSESHHFPITIVRGEPAVALAKSCNPASIKRGETTNCTITITNNSFEDANVSVTDQLPSQLSLVSGSVTGATQSGNGLSFDGTLFAAAPPLVNVAISPTATVAGYAPLSAFGVAPLSGVSDESIINLAVPNFMYAGESYNQIGVVSNGYVVVGGGSGADVQFINSDLPDPTAPNNTLAAFWTDLNPSTSGSIRVGILTDGVNNWIVVDWEKVPNFSNPAELNSFQIWIGVGTVEDITFVYGPAITSGDGGFLTVGAENKFGNSGGTIYRDGAGTAPSPSNTTGYVIDVFSVPGEPGETHVITFAANGDKAGAWTNCAEMTSELFQGVNISCTSGQVTR